MLVFDAFDGIIVVGYISDDDNHADRVVVGVVDEGGGVGADDVANEVAAALYGSVGFDMTEYVVDAVGREVVVGGADDVAVEVGDDEAGEVGCTDGPFEFAVDSLFVLSFDRLIEVGEVGA